MRHDPSCERGSEATSGCRCASRAYSRDPLPDDVTPIYADPKTPNQEGS